GQVTADATQPLVKPVLAVSKEVNPKVTPDQLVPNYTNRKADILKITDAYTQKDAENKLNKELSTNIRNEIRELEELKSIEPGNADIQKRIDNLKKLDDVTNSSIVANEKWMAENPKTETVVVDASDVKAVNPDYQVSVDKIDKIVDPNQKAAAIEELNTTTLDKIDTRIKELDKVLAQNPNDQAALTEKNELNGVKSQIQNNPDKTFTNPTDVSSINTKATISEIMPDYQTKMNQINGSAESTV